MSGCRIKLVLDSILYGYGFLTMLPLGVLLSFGSTGNNDVPLITGQSVFEREAPTFRKDNCSRPPTAQYVEARGMIEVSFESLWEYKWRYQRVFVPDEQFSSVDYEVDLIV